MFEKLIENLLQSILGQYVEGLDQQSLKVGIWSGEAKIENLRLKPDALLKLDLPFLVKYSRLGTLNLNIPWKNLASSPLRASLDTLYLILQPQQQSDWKFGCVTAADKLIEMDTFKQKLLNRLTNQEQADGMMQRIVIRVLENLQIRIQNIHIRVEDNNFSYGFILQNFNLLTVNEQGVEQFIDRTSNKNQQLIKCLSISNIGLYWQWRGSQAYDEEKLSSEITDYIFRLSLKCKVVQPPKVINQQLPDYSFDIDLEKLDISFSKPQVQQIINLMDFMNLYNRSKLQFQKQQSITQPLDEIDQAKMKQLLLSVPLEKKIKDGLNQAQTQELFGILDKTQIDDVKLIILEVMKVQQFEDMKQKALKKKQPKSFLAGWFGRGKQQQQSEETPTLILEEQEEITNFLEQNFQPEDQSQKKITTIVVHGQMQQGTITISNPRQKTTDEIKILFQDLSCQLTMDKDFRLSVSLIDLLILFNTLQFLTNTSNDQLQPFFLLNFNLIESTHTQLELTTRSSKLKFRPDIVTVLCDFGDVEMKSDQIKNMADDRIQELKQNAQVALANQIVAQSQRWVNITMNQLFIELPINNQESWLFCPGLVKITSSIVNTQEKYAIELSSINLTHLSVEKYSVVDNFTIQLEIMLPNQEQKNLSINAQIQDIITNLHPSIYEKLTKIGDCFAPSLSAEEYKKQGKLEEIEKSKLVEQAIKIGPLFIREGQLNQWVKHTCMISGSYLYCYATPKSAQPNYIKWIKNSVITVSGVDEFNMNILIIQNDTNQFEVGVQNQGHIKDWKDKILSLQDQDQILLQQIGEISHKVQPIEFEKLVTFSISKVQINLQDSNSKQFLIARTNNLSIKMKIHSQFIQLQLSLHGLQIQDSLRMYKDPKMQDLITSEQSKSGLIEITFTSIQRTAKNYQDTDTQIGLKFGDLHINFKSETLAYLIQFLNLNLNNENQQKQLDQAEQIFLEAQKPFLLMKLNVQIQSISLSIIHEISKLPFAAIRFQNSEIEMLKYQDELQIEVKLGNLQVYDLTNHPYTLTQEEDYDKIIPNQIIGIKQLNQSLLHVNVIVIEPLSKKAAQDRNLIIIDAKISQIVADYQQQPVLRFIDYVQNLKEPFLNSHSFSSNGFIINSVNNNKAAPSKIIINPFKDEAEKIVADPPKVKLNIQIDNPQILIRNKFQSQFLTINLGQISVRNDKQQINGFFKDIYNIEIIQLSIFGESENKKSTIASEFNLKLQVMLPDLLPFYKVLNQKPDETMYVNAELSPFILNIDQMAMKLINRLVAYNFTLNDSFEEYILLNTEKSNQITSEEQKIILKQDVEKKARNQDTFLKLKLNLTNISIFLCIDRPLMRLSIVNTNIEFKMKKDDKKELSVQISSFNACVYEQINGYYISKPLIGVQKEIKYERLNDLQILIGDTQPSEKESAKIEMFINPTANKTHNTLYLTFQSFLLTVQTKVLLQAITVFESEQLQPYVNENLVQYQRKFQDLVKNQSKEEENQPTDSQIFITLGGVTLAIPSSDNSVITITGKFNIIINTFDTMNLDELVSIIQEKGLNEFDLVAMNYKIKSTISIEQVEAFVTLKDQLYSKDFNELEKRQLIWPFTMLINQSQQLVISENFDSLVENSSIRMSLSQFQFRMAFLDILFIQRQIEAQLDIVNQLANNDIKKQKQVNQEQSSGQMKLELAIDGIEVIILNDLDNYYQYILNFKLFQNDIKLEQNFKNIKFVTAFPISLIYFNQNIGIWEPIIEKSIISILFLKDLTGFSDVGVNQLIIQLPDVVNINIATQMITSVYSALTILKQQLQIKNHKQISCLSQSYAKYALYNQLGQDILCETQDNQIIISQFNQYTPFDVKSNRQQNYVQLQIQGDRYPYEISNWNIDKLQSKVIKNNENFTVLVKNFVDPTKNQRVIYLSSEFIVQNNTLTHLDLIFKDKKENTYEFKLQAHLESSNKVTCQPNQLVIPSNLLFYDFCLRKSDNPQEKSQFYNVQYLRQCHQNNETLRLWLNKSFIIILNICKDPQFNGRLVVYVQPNFRLQNLLPFPVKLTTLYETTMGEEYQLQPMQFMDEHLLQNVKQNHGIKIEIDSYKSSQPILLLNSRTFKWQQNIVNIQGEQWSGSNGGRSELILEYNYSLFEQSGLCSAVLYAQECIKNETQYEYIVFQGKNSHYSILGGQKGGSKSRPLILNNTQEQNELVFSGRETPQVLSLTPAFINSIGTSVGDIIFKKGELFYIAPLAVTSEIKLVQQTCQKLVTVKNRIILVNNCEFSACIKQLFTSQEIKPQERIPFEICYGDKLPNSNEKIYQFQLTLIEGYNWNWSGNIECNQVGVFYLQLRSQKFAGVRKFIQVDINESNGILFVVLSETKHDQTPYRISNFSKVVDITILNIPAELELNQECFFAQDDPTRKNDVGIYIRPKNKALEILEYQLNIDKIMEAKFFVVGSKNKQDPTRIYLRLMIEIEGYTRHAKFYDSSEEELSRYKDSNQKQLIKEQPIFKFDIMINQINLGLIDNYKCQPMELFNIVLYQCEAIMLINKSNKAVFQFKISGLQIDNTSQLFPHFPVVLTLLPRGKTQTMPILNILVQMNLQAKQLQQIDKFTVEFNCLSVKINDTFIKSVLSTVNKITKILENQEQRVEPKLDWKRCQLPDKLIPTYIGQLAIYPIILEITISWGKKDKDSDSTFVVASLLSGLGFQLVSVDEAEINLKGIKIDDVFDSLSGLSNRLMNIYLPNIYTQLPAILGSLAVIGNPTKLLKNFVSGMQDLVERPIEGFTKGPLEGGMGVLSGAGSLVSHTVSGVFNSVKNVVGSISNGLTKVTMDQNYQQQRQIQNQQQAKNVGSGLAEGSVSLVKGVAGGVFGFFSKPIQGAQENGASGLVKGLWQGTSGLIIKPVTGVLDVITKTSEGVKNQLSSDEQPNNLRIRYLRPFYESDGYFKDYNWIDGESYEVIQGIKKGQLAHHRMIRVVVIERDKKQFAIILTDQSLILFDLNKHLKLWCLLYRDLESISSQGDVIQLKNIKSKKAFQGKSITYLNLSSPQQCQQLTEEIKFMQHQM